MSLSEPVELRIPCEKCGGCGKRPLTESQRLTVAAVGPEWTTSNEISARLTGASTVSTTLTNQLTSLHGAGVLDRRPWSGRNYQWRITKQVA
jgi:hypothetical protein